MDFHDYLRITEFPVDEKYWDNPSRESHEKYLEEGGNLSWIRFKQVLITNRKDIEERQGYTTKDAYELYRNRGGELPWDKFVSICRSFNTKIADELIYKARYFNMGYRLGTLRVVVTKRRKPSIDWGASNKRKEELIKEGKTPYNKEDAPDGEKWFVYHENDSYCRFYWRNFPIGFRNQSAYVFDPSRGNGYRTFGIVDRLKEHIYEDELNVLDYDSFDKIKEAMDARTANKNGN